tara:strand:+ start:2482 stop:3528 length:1047 start_codon:yes stop_codon:yes gene_type:complete
MKKKFEIKIFSEFNEELEKKWTTLEKEANITIFQTYNWQKYWYLNCGHDIKIVNVLIFDYEKLIAILPFHIKKKIFKILSWNGFPFSDYNLPIIRNNTYIKNEDYKNIFLDLKKNYNFDVLHLINNADSDFYNKKNFISNKTYKLNLNEEKTYKEIVDKLKKKIKYENNKIKKNYKLEINLKPSNNEKKEIINFFVKQKANQLERTRGWNYLNLERYKNYIVNIQNLNNEVTNYSFIKLNGKIVASHIGYNFRNIFFYIFPVYDVNFKKFSLGNILLLNILEFCETNKIICFDLTIGDEKYKEKLSNKVENLYEVIESFNSFGFVYKLYIISKSIIKNFVYLLKKNFR